MDHSLIVNKKSGLIGIKIKQDFFNDDIHVLTKAATDTSQTEVTFDKVSNWEPFQVSEHYYKVHTDS